MVAKRGRQRNIREIVVVVGRGVLFSTNCLQASLSAEENLCFKGEMVLKTKYNAIM